MQQPNEIDLRLNKSSPGLVIQAGQPIYTIVDSLDLGTSGPFFLDKGRAILWGFFRGNADKSLMPIRETVKPRSAFSMFEQVSPNKYPAPILQQAPASQVVKLTEEDYDSYNLRKGRKANKFMFPGRNKVLLELKSPYTVRFDQIIEGDDPIELGLLFCPDVKYGAKLETKIAVYYPSLTTVDFRTANEWIDKRPDGSINTNISFSNLLDRRLKINMTTNQTTGLSNLNIMSATVVGSGRIDRTPTERGLVLSQIFEKVTGNALILCRPQQLFANRTIYYLDWEAIWEHFITTRVNNNDLETTKNSFAAAADNFHGAGIDASRTNFPKSFILRLLAQLDTTKDVISLCSVNKSFRGVCFSSIGQRLLRERFQPWLDSFMTRVVTLPRYHNIFPGVPKAFEIRYHGLWPVGFIFFQNDFVSGSAEVEMENLTGKPQEVDANIYQKEMNKQTKQEESEELKRKKLVEERIREKFASRGIHLPGGPLPGFPAYNVENEEEKAAKEALLRSINEQIEPKRLDDNTLNNIIRNSCSFISLFAMVRSMGNLFNGITIIEIVFNGRFDSETFNYEKQVRAEKVAPRNSFLLSSNIQSSKETDSTLYNIDLINIKGSWMHETPVLPFFQNPDYVNVLERVKVLEKKRTQLRIYMRELLMGGHNVLSLPVLMNPDPILSQALTNKLIIYRNGEILAWIEITTYGNPIKLERLYMENLEETIVFMFRNDALKKKSLTRLRTHLLYQVYHRLPENPGINEAYEYYQDDEMANVELSGPSDRILMRIHPLYDQQYAQYQRINRYTGIYYAQYMFLISFIRLMVLEEGGDSLDWSVNI